MFLHRSQRLWLALLSLAGLGVVIVFVSRTDADLDAAERAVARREFQSASEHYDHYPADPPNDRFVPILPAWAARRNGDYEAAVRHLKKYQPTSGRKGDDGHKLEARLLNAQQGDVRELQELMAK